MTLYLHEEEIRREALRVGEANGLAKGKAEGLAEGILLQTIKYYLKNKISIEEALEDTGLNKDDFLESVNTYKMQ